MNFFFKNVYIDYNIKPKYIEKLPIVSCNEHYQKSLIQIVNAILELNRKLQEIKSRYFSRIQSNFEIKKISKKLDAFYEHDFKTFVAELKKQKIILNLNQQDEWEEYFNQYKSQINQIQQQISQTDKEIDQMVYGLYGLTEEEIKIVEESVK